MSDSQIYHQIGWDRVFCWFTTSKSIYRYLTCCSETVGENVLAGFRLWNLLKECFRLLKFLQRNSTKQSNFCIVLKKTQITIKKLPSRRLHIQLQHLLEHLLKLRDHGQLNRNRWETAHFEQPAFVPMQTIHTGLSMYFPTSVCQHDLPLLTTKGRLGLSSAWSEQHFTNTAQVTAVLAAGRGEQAAGPNKKRPFLCTGLHRYFCVFTEFGQNATEKLVLRAI